MIIIIFQALPDAEASRRTIQRARGGRFPANVPLEELIVDGQFASTLGDNPTPFLLADNKNNEQRIILFASHPCLRELANAEEWYMDGNFNISPPQFQQVI